MGGIEICETQLCFLSFSINIIISKIIQNRSQFPANDRLSFQLNDTIQEIKMSY